jgi:hypothetical protein
VAVTHAVTALSRHRHCGQRHQRRHSSSAVSSPATPVSALQPLAPKRFVALSDLQPAVRPRAISESDDDGAASAARSTDRPAITKVYHRVRMTRSQAYERVAQVQQVLQRRAAAAATAAQQQSGNSAASTRPQRRTPEQVLAYLMRRRAAPPPASDAARRCANERD